MGVCTVRPRGAGNTYKCASVARNGGKPFLTALFGSNVTEQLLIRSVAGVSKPGSMFPTSYIYVVRSEGGRERPLHGAAEEHRE